MVLPDMAGAELFAAMVEVNPQASILLFSGFSSDKVAQDLLHQGAVGFFQKPFTLTKLSAQVAAALRRHEQASIREEGVLTRARD